MTEEVQVLVDILKGLGFKFVNVEEVYNEEDEETFYSIMAVGYLIYDYFEGESSAQSLYLINGGIITYYPDNEELIIYLPNGVQYRTEVSGFKIRVYPKKVEVFIGISAES